MRLIARPIALSPVIKRIAVGLLTAALCGVSSPGSPLAEAAHTSGSTSSGSTFTPMAVQSQNYTFANSFTSCLGEDDSLQWSAAGDLQPGQSFTFTPTTPDCAGHITAITTALSWSGSQLQLSSAVPASDFTDGDPAQAGKTIVAPDVGNTAALCMFPAYNSTGPNVFNSFTVTNVGTTTATNVTMSGTDQNDWVSNFYYQCLNADADNSGWNDAFKHAMAILTYYVPNEPMYGFQGVDYLRTSGAAAAGAGTDAFPPDVNGDGVVDQKDVSLVQQYVGQGNGIPISEISPNPGDANYLYNQTLAWRRYDLDGDGFVAQNDVTIVQAYVGHTLPATSVVIPPMARITQPANGTSVMAGTVQSLGAYAFSPTALTKVQFLVNGTVVCTTSTPHQTVTVSTYPLYGCTWSVPKKRGATYTLSAVAYDGSGHSGSGPSTTVNS